MNYIQILADIHSKLSYYHRRLKKIQSNDRIYSFRDIWITYAKIAKLEKLLPKVGRRVAQQFGGQNVR